jgi:hypothetical protein
VLRVAGSIMRHEVARGSERSVRRDQPQVARATRVDARVVRRLAVCSRGEENVT